MTDKDKALHAGLMKLLNEATFSLKAKEVNSFMAVYNWSKEIPEMISDKKKPAQKRNKSK